MATTIEQAYAYLAPSRVSADGRAVRLSTSGGRTSTGSSANPYFFAGFLAHAEQTAAALLLVARVARTRFYTPPGMLAAKLLAADPVVTSNGDRLRFESFSACCGVYARLDVLPECLDGLAQGTGTTNVDFNAEMRAALAQIRGLDPLHLQVGDDVTVTTLDAQVVERKVPLPSRWLKGFAEVQLTAATMAPAFDVTAIQARRFLASLPRSGSAGSGSELHVTPTARGLRLTSVGGPGIVAVAGAQRLRVLEPAMQYAHRLTAYAASTGGSAWVLELADSRLTVALSPGLSRGFSGEGGVLWDLADDNSAEDADLLAALLAYEPRIEIDALQRFSGLSLVRVRHGLGRLAAAGRVGYDLGEDAYFHRELPYDPAALATLHPRLIDARGLVDAGAVRIADDLAYVRSGSTDYVVRRAADRDTCTCPWYGKHRGDRGPCKHVLAADLARRLKH